jgi:hypothetical protein
METKRRPGRPRNIEREQIEQTLGVKKRQANDLIKSGVTTEHVGDLQSAKLRKLILESSVLEEKLAILKRENIPAAKVRESALSACSIFKSEAMALEINLPPLLEGLHAGEMRTVISGHVQRLLKDVCDRLESIT